MAMAALEEPLTGKVHSELGADLRPVLAGGWRAGDIVEAEGDDGWERGVTVLGASAGGDPNELHVRFADGVQDDWPVKDIRLRAPDKVPNDDRSQHVQAKPRTAVEGDSAFQAEHTDPRVAIILGRERAKQMPTAFTPETAAQVLNSSAWKYCDPHTFDGQCTRLTILDNQGCPPMLLVTLNDLKAHGRIPMYGEGVGTLARELLELHGQDIAEGEQSTIQPAARLVTVMYSHRWLRPWWTGPCADGQCGVCETGCGVSPPGETHLGSPCGHPDNEDMDKFESLVAFGDWCMGNAHSNRSHRRRAKSAASDKNISAFAATDDLGRHVSLSGRISRRPEEVAFWIDYACVDQDEPGPGIAALPLYVAACQLILCHESVDYEIRAWTRAERALAYAFSPGGDLPFVIDAAGLRRDGQVNVRIARRALSDSRTGQLTHECVLDATGRCMSKVCDKRLVHNLSFAAESSEIYSPETVWKREIKNLPATEAQGMDPSEPGKPSKQIWMTMWFYCLYALFYLLCAGLLAKDARQFAKSSAPVIVIAVIMAACLKFAYNRDAASFKSLVEEKVREVDYNNGDALTAIVFSKQTEPYLDMEVF